MYSIPAVGEEGILAYCDLMSFELSLWQTFQFDTDVIFSCTDINLKIMYISLGLCSKYNMSPVVFTITDQTVHVYASWNS